MPWPPTGYLEPTVDMATQIASPTMAGIESEVDQDPASPLFDPTTGLIMPGVSDVEDPFSALPNEEERKMVGPPDGDTSKARELVIQYAKEKLGMWYVWGGESDAEGGYDCSGLLYYAFKKAGIDMPRVSYTQARRGKHVDVSQLQAGDLVAWDNNPDIAGADHIALYIGNGQILEAARTGTRIRIRKLRKGEGAFGVKLSY